jgi:hypothetical protein
MMGSVGQWAVVNPRAGVTARWHLLAGIVVVAAGIGCSGGFEIGVVQLF